MTVADILREEAAVFDARFVDVKARIFEPKSALEVTLPVVLQLSKGYYTYDALMVSGGDPYPAAVFYVYEGGPTRPVTVASEENLREVIRAALESEGIASVVAKISNEIPG